MDFRGLRSWTRPIELMARRQRFSPLTPTSSSLGRLISREFNAWDQSSLYVEISQHIYTSRKVSRLDRVLKCRTTNQIALRDIISFIILIFLLKFFPRRFREVRYNFFRNIFLDNIEFEETFAEIISAKRFY